MQALKYFQTNRWKWKRTIVFGSLFIAFLWIGSKLALFLSSGNLLFRRNILKIISNWQIKSTQCLNTKMLILPWPWALFESGFLIIWKTFFLEQWQLTNKFSVRKVNCDGNTLLPAKRELTLFFKTNKVLAKNFVVVNLI